jgi:hypothetical protein
LKIGVTRSFRANPRRACDGDQPEPKQEPDTPFEALDDLDTALRRAKALVGILGNGAAADANFNDAHVSEALSLIENFLSDAQAARDRLDGFRVRGVS